MKGWLIHAQKPRNKRISGKGQGLTGAGVCMLCAYMLNTRNEENNTVFYSYLACFVNTFTLNMYVSMSCTGLTRRNTLFVFLWLRHRNT